jgi:hypothetical protein
VGDLDAIDLTQVGLMSRVVRPRAYKLKIMSEVFPIRRRRLGTICGSKLPLRSRGTSIRA